MLGYLWVNKRGNYRTVEINMKTALIRELQHTILEVGEGQRIMKKVNLITEGIPAILWGETSDKLFIAIHGNMSSKDDEQL